MDHLYQFRDLNQRGRRECGRETPVELLKLPMHPGQTGSDAAVSVSEFVVSSLPEDQRAGEWPRKTMEMKIKQSFIPKLWAQLKTKQKQNLHPHHWENRVLKSTRGLRAQS